jgi:hypothetical protein
MDGSEADRAQDQGQHRCSPFRFDLSLPARTSHYAALLPFRHLAGLFSVFYCVADAPHPQLREPNVKFGKFMVEWHEAEFPRRALLNICGDAELAMDKSHAALKDDWEHHAHRDQQCRTS